MTVAGVFLSPPYRKGSGGRRSVLAMQWVAWKHMKATSSQVRVVTSSPVTEHTTLHVSAQ